MAKTITYADRAKVIHKKFYSNRKPGEDSMTDEAFNKEMEELAESQEATKSMQAQDNFEQERYGNGGELSSNPYKYGTAAYYTWERSKTPNNVVNSDKPINSSQLFLEDKIKPREAIAAIKNSSQNNYVKTRSTDLPKHWDGNYLTGINTSSTFDPNERQYNSIGKQYKFGKHYSMGDDFNLGINYGDNESSDYQYSPTANILGPALQTGANLIASKIAADSVKKTRKRLLDSVNLGRITPQEVDYSRERSDIRANAALSDATGRYIARNARSASEAANIANAARISSQRVAGSQLGQSLQNEQNTNAQLRGEADKYNKQLQAQESEMKLAIEQRYGDLAPQIWADFVQKTGQTVNNYISENKKMKSDAEYLKSVAPWHEIQYDTKDGFWNKFGYKTGIVTPKRRVSVKSQYFNS